MSSRSDANQQQRVDEIYVKVKGKTGTYRVVDSKSNANLYTPLEEGGTDVASPGLSTSSRDASAAKRFFRRLTGDSYSITSSDECR